MSLVRSIRSIERHRRGVADRAGSGERGGGCRKEETWLVAAAAAVPRRRVQGPWESGRRIYEAD